MKKLLIFILLITLVGILPALLQYGNFLLATDMADQEVPFIIETKRMLMSGSPFWSWNHVIGDNFIGTYSFYTLTSPFVWINCLFPDQWMLFGITFTLFLKMLCVGMAAWAYLRKMDISEESSIVGALMYTFSSFAVSNLFYYHFMEPMIAFPLFLIAIERFIRKERYGGVGMILASFLVFFINFYFASCSMIAGLIYVLCRMRSKEIKVGFGRTIYGMSLVGIGLLLSCFISLPTVAHLSGNPRQSFDWRSLFNGAVGCIERLRTLFEPKLQEGPNPAFEAYVYGFSSNAANIPVVGVLLAGLYVLRRKDWLSALVVISLILYVTPLNGVFSFFTTPSYSRWAYALTLFLVLASMKFVDAKLPLKKRHFWTYAAVCCTAVTLAYAIGLYCDMRFNGSIPHDSSSITINLIIQGVFLLQMAVLFFFVKHNNAKTLLWCVVLMTIIYFPLRVLMNTDAYNESGYRSEWCGAIDHYILDNHLPYNYGDFEWRTDFLAFFPNVTLQKNRPSVSTFSSIQNTSIAPLMMSIGSPVGENIIKVNKNAVSYDALMSVKEIVVFEDSLLTQEPSRLPCLGDKHTGEGYTAYDNKYYIPMGFTYDSFIGQSAIDSLMKANEKADVPMQLLANLVIPDSLITVVGEIMEKGSIDSGVSLDSLVGERRKHTCSTFAGDTRGFKATVTLPRRNLLFFSVPCDKGFTGYVDGEETKIYTANLGLSAIMVDEGQHQVEFRFFPQGLREGFILTLIGLLLTLIVLVVERSRKRHAGNRSIKH